MPGGISFGSCLKSPNRLLPKTFPGTLLGTGKCINECAMKNLLGLIISILLLSAAYAQDKLVTDKGHVSFFANAPVADVDARNEQVKMELNTKSGELVINMAMTDFKFKSEKMGRDAEKKYLETEKFTKASFKGKVEGKVDYKKAGSYPVVAVGKMTVHGVEKDLKEKGTRSEERRVGKE